MMDRDYLEDMILGYESDLKYFKNELKRIKDFTKCNQDNMLNSNVAFDYGSLSGAATQTQSIITSLKKLISYLDEIN